MATGVCKGVGWLLAAMVFAGCGADRRNEERARLAQIEADGKALDQAADQLESRLLADQSSVQLWQELAWRHQHVSAIATQNANEHLQGIERFIARQDQKVRAMKRRRIASAEVYDVGGEGPQRASSRRSSKRRN